MKKLIPLSLMLLLLAGVGTSQAQTAEQPLGFKLKFGTSAYNGDLGNEILEYTSNDFLYGVGLSAYLSRYFDLSLDAQLYELDKVNGPTDRVVSKRNTSFSSQNINLDLMLRFKPFDTRLNPYLAAGAGFNIIRDGDDGDIPDTYKEDTNTFFSIPFGIGVNYQLKERIMLNVQAIYHRSFDDDIIDGYPIDGSDAIDGNSQSDIDGVDHDDIFTTSIGVVYNFGGGASDDDLERRLLKQSMENLEAAEQSSDEASNTLQQAQQLNDETLAALDELRNAIDQMPEKSEELKAEMVRVVNNVQFEFDKAEIIEPAHDELNSLAAIMQEYQGLGIDIAARADERGAESYNEELSMRRAEAVKTYLVDQGVSSSRITTSALGETDPLMSGNSSTAYAQNRSVQVTLSYNGGM